MPDNRYLAYVLQESVDQQAADYSYHKEHSERNSGALDPERVTIGVGCHWPGALTKRIVTGYR
jgi:hypothetical protein